MQVVDVDALGPVTSAHAESVLACRRQQTHPNDCGPFAAAAIIQALTGRPVVAEELAAALDRPRRRGLWGILPLVRRLPRYATFPWGVADALRQHGLQAGWRFGMEAEDLIERLARGELLVPIVGAWRPKPWAHYMVLLAHNPGRGWGFADPASPHQALRWYADADFRDAWSAMGRMAVTIPPQAGDSEDSGPAESGGPIA